MSSDMKPGRGGIPRYRRNVYPAWWVQGRKVMDDNTGFWFYEDLTTRQQGERRDATKPRYLDWNVRGNLED